MSAVAKARCHFYVYFHFAVLAGTNKRLRNDSKSQVPWALRYKGAVLPIHALPKQPGMAGRVLRDNTPLYVVWREQSDNVYGTEYTIME